MSSKAKADGDFMLSDLAVRKLQRELESVRGERDLLAETVEIFQSKRREYEFELPTSSRELRFGLFGDTQIGSLYERTDALAVFFDAMVAYGIRDAFACGDIVEGHGMYPGQEFETYARGHDEQINAAVARIPHRKSIKVRFITGNHDASYKKRAGVQVGNRLADKTGWEFLGQDYAMVKLRTKDARPWKLALFHPSDGTAYALSYKSQKKVDSLSGGESKPNMIAIGHYHKAEMLPSYRNLCVIQTGCFQSQTPYMAGKGIAAHVGGWLISVKVGSARSLSNQITATFVPFYEPK